MTATNYFKVRSPTGERVFPFDHWRRSRIRDAYKAATSCPGRMVVFYPVPLSGPWDSLPAIAAQGAPMPVAKKAPRRSALTFAMFGEGGCL